MGCKIYVNTETQVTANALYLPEQSACHHVGKKRGATPAWGGGPACHPHSKPVLPMVAAP